jgi:hypothetical protein
VTKHLQVQRPSIVVESGLETGSHGKGVPPRTLSMQANFGLDPTDPVHSVPTVWPTRRSVHRVLWNR